MINAVNILLIIALIIFSLLDIYGLYADKEGLCLVSKPFLVPLIIALYVLPQVLSARGTGSPASIIITLVIGLAFGWLGDVLLMKKEFFIFGLLAFLAGHIFYIITFARDIRLFGTSWLLLLVILPYILVILFVKKNLIPFLWDKKLVPGIVIYMLVIIAMSVCAFLFNKELSFSLCHFFGLGTLCCKRSGTCISQFQKEPRHRGGSLYYDNLHSSPASHHAGNRTY